FDVAGQKKDAAKHFERSYKLDPTALRVVQAYGSFLARQGNTADALKVFAAFDEALPRHPLIVEAINELKAGKKLPLMVDTPQAGAAEVLYGLGAALGRRGGEDLGLIYLQLALYLASSHPLALLSLGDLYEAMKKPELANKIYERVPLSSPLHRNAQIQLALNLDTLDRTDEAKASLEKLIAANPNDLEAIMALGNVLRGRKQFAECADVYSKGIDTIGKPEKSNWMIYYFRGICFERAKQWPKAEADLKKSLDLFPDQPHVLNYLGYSWIDQGINLDEGMRMIKRAVEQRADDGYIVDSLGWAYYRLGNMEEAVKQLERAVELKPEDPTINDHLEDAYWRVGRLLEARFQWSHARDLKPEPEENLVLKAARALAERIEGLTLGHFALSKRLPVAAGLGGGSADAAAALRILARVNALALDDPRVMQAARATGADVPVCLDPRTQRMRGVGEVLSEPLKLPRIPAVLVNPGVSLATKDVFEALDP